MRWPEARIIEGNVFDVLPTIERGSIDCVVNSPPYWALRSYLPKGHALKHLELGSEKTTKEYIANMVRVFGLVRETMADHATCWLNIGDSYAGGHSGESALDKLGERYRGGGHSVAKALQKRPKNRDLESGNLCLIPQRLAIALQDDGWVVRSVIVWHKPAPMPASLSGWRWMRCRVKTKQGWGQDRPHPSHSGNGSGEMCASPVRKMTTPKAEWLDCSGCKKCSKTDGFVLRKGSWRPTSSWEPILMLAKTADYFADGDAVKQPPAEATVSRDQYTRVLDDPDEQFAVKHDHETVCDGANLRDVWKIASEALKEKHYAAFPTALVERCLLAGTSAKGYCPTCGMPWVRVIEELGHRAVSGFSESISEKDGESDGESQNGNRIRDGHVRGLVRVDKTFDWRPSCRCPPSEPRPGRVLDPFSGSGRTGIAANRLDLDYVGVELNPDYVTMSRKLLTKEAPLYRQE